MSQATTKSKTSKPAKPYPDFPLFPHATKRWAKKIRGKMHYFGSWADPQTALQKYLDLRDDLYAGRTPRVSADGFILRDVVNRFLTTKQDAVDTGELSARSFADYHATCGRLLDAFGKSRLVTDLLSEDFEHLRRELAKTRGIVALGNEIQRIRVVFKYCYDAGLIDKPIRYGPTFRRPSKKALRRVRQAKGPQMFQAEEICAMLDVAPLSMRAMILLGVNCAFGNNDCATLPLSAIDLDAGWHHYARPKTGVERRAPLWPETVAALREVIATRPKPKDAAHEQRMFITKSGQSWAKSTSDNPISKEFAKILVTIGKRPKPLPARRGKAARKRGPQPRRPGHTNGRNFYALRHTFETIGGGTLDQIAVDFLMGHARDDMASVYREDISDERLRAVTNCIRKWLFAKKRSKKNQWAAG